MKFHKNAAFKLLIGSLLLSWGFLANADLLDVVNAGLVQRDGTGYFRRGANDSRIAVDESQVCLAIRESDNGDFLIFSPQPGGPQLKTRALCGSPIRREDVADIISFMGYDWQTGKWKACEYIHLENAKKFDGSCG